MRKFISYSHVAILVSATISFYYVFDIYMDAPWEAIQKSMILFLMAIPLFFRVKTYVRLYPIYAFFVVYATSLFVDNTYFLLITKAFVGFLIPWLILLTRFSVCDLNVIPLVIVKLPLISIVIGGVLQATGVYELFRYEYTGVYRLQGALIPAHLGFLGVFGVVFSAQKIIEKSRGFTMYFYINLIIVLLSGSRMALLVAGCVFVYMYAIHIKDFVGRGKKRVSAIVFLSLVVMSSAYYVPELIDRTFNNSINATQYGLDASGRFGAWMYFLDLANEKPIFGHGLGMIQLANEGNLNHGFVVPHNEFIHFYYDGGLVGVSIIMIAIIYWMYSVSNAVGKGDKWFFLYFCALTMVYAFTDNIYSTLQYSMMFAYYAKYLLEKNKLTKRVGMFSYG